MQQYLDFLDDIYHTCHTLRLNRTGTPDIGKGHALYFQHDMSLGFPLMTTKFVSLKNVATELECFIHGVTDKKWLKDRKCNIWNQWANPERVNTVYDIASAGKNLDAEQAKILRDKITDHMRDLGPIYGWQWRHFGGEYRWNPNDPAANYNPARPGIDQLAQAINKAKNHPEDRRNIVSAWNPTDFHLMALPPCHMFFQLIIRDGFLSLVFTQRSCDMFLGVPYDIASYALLLLLFTKKVGLKPGVLQAELHDCHIYKNHLAAVAEQLTRKPHPLPTVEIPDENWNGLLNWHADGGFVLKNYIHDAALKASVAR